VSSPTSPKYTGMRSTSLAAEYEASLPNSAGRKSENSVNLPPRTSLSATLTYRQRDSNPNPYGRTPLSPHIANTRAATPAESPRPSGPSPRSPAAAEAFSHLRNMGGGSPIGGMRGYSRRRSSGAGSEVHINNASPIGWNTDPECPYDRRTQSWSGVRRSSRRGLPRRQTRIKRSKIGTRRHRGSLTSTNPNLSFTPTSS